MVAIWFCLPVSAWMLREILFLTLLNSFGFLWGNLRKSSGQAPITVTTIV